MKKIILLICLFQIIAMAVFSQATRVQIRGMQGQRLNGFIVHIDSNSVILTKGWSKSILQNAQYRVSKISIADIKEIRFKGKTNAVKGFFIGALTGLTTGLTMGLTYDAVSAIVGDEPPRTGDYTLSGALIGGVFGAILGSDSRKTLKKVFIRGNLDSFNLYRAELQAIVLR